MAGNSTHPRTYPSETNQSGVHAAPAVRFDASAGVAAARSEDKGARPVDERRGLSERREEIGAGRQPAPTARPTTIPVHRVGDRRF
jgi:hypothetical protein